MKNGITLTEKKRNELVLNILTDAVIFTKTTEAINLLNNIGSPKDAEDWEPEYMYNGLTTAYYLLGIPAFESFENEQKLLPIVDVLRKIFDNALSFNDCRTKENKMYAKDIAKEVFEEWQAFLNNLHLDLRKAS